MEEKISFLVPKDLCEGCIVTRCKKMLNDKTQCYLNRKPYALVGNKVPNNIEDVKEILDKTIEEKYKKGINTDAFVLNDYNSYIPPLMYAYQVTGDKKYLDAAEYVAEWMTTALWVPVCWM